MVLTKKIIIFQGSLLLGSHSSGASPMQHFLYSKCFKMQWLNSLWFGLAKPSDEKHTCFVSWQLKPTSGIPCSIYATSTLSQ